MKILLSLLATAALLSGCNNNDDYLLDDGLDEALEAVEMIEKME